MGVNGSGKTTSIAKLGKRFTQRQERAAGRGGHLPGQRQWTSWKSGPQRLDLPVISGQMGGDSAAVAYDTVQAAHLAAKRTSR